MNYKDPQEEANVVDYAVTTELVIIAEPEPFTFWHYTTPVAALLGKSDQLKPVELEPFIVTVYTYWVITLGRVAIYE